MPGTNCFFVESFVESGLDLDNLFGIFYAKVKTNNLYLGLLPVRTNKGLIFPNGAFEGIWTSEELKFARSKGYEINVIKGYQFNKINNIFDSYINNLFNKKKKFYRFFKINL